MPFIRHFVTHFDNPWQHFFLNPTGAEFPYHPFMLYIFSFFSYFPIVLAKGASWGITNFFFKIPLFIADISIAFIFLKLFKNKEKEVLFYYFASPIILFSTYMHSQLDIIPTALLMGSLYFLFQKKFTVSGVLFGLAVGSKFHVITALPLLVIYLYKLRNKPAFFKFLGWSGLIYGFLVLPYLFTPGLWNLVLHNPKQDLIFNLGMAIENNIIFVTIALILLIYGKFCWYKKINQDLLFSFIGILFSAFVLLVLPRPGWYVWIIPFLSFFLIRHQKKDNINENKLVYLYLYLNVAYIFYFVFLNITEVPDLTYFQSTLNLKILSNGNLSNLVYTMLEVSLFAMIIALYVFGVKSNEVYKRIQSIVIGIGGDSGSGKSMALKSIKNLNPEKILELESDGVHKWERKDQNWNNYTHSDPKANNLHSLANQLHQLKTGQTIHMRFYDHDKGTFTETELIAPNSYILLSGLHPFYLPHMRKLVDIKIFMDTDETLRKAWKIRRDTKERGHSFDTVLKSIKKRELDSKKYIQSQKEFADIVVHYYSENAIDFENEKAISQKLNLNLKVTINAEINLEPLISECSEQGILKNWDYSDDLNSLYLDVSKPLDKQSLQKCAEENVFNLSEIMDPLTQLESGYQGFLQLIILFYISEKMKTKVS
ncbi:MAG: hypothetical protein GY730_08055 [bacterium]|nr:hypothetical protein [bacterium]